MHQQALLTITGRKKFNFRNGELLTQSPANRMQSTDKNDLFTKRYTKPPFGEPIEISSDSEVDDAGPINDLDREIEAFRKQHDVYNAVLINNSAGRVLNKEGQVIGSEGLGEVVNPQEVLIIARTMVADPVVKLYTSIKKIPDCAHTVRILYTESPDRSQSSLLGYTIENSQGVYTKFVKYDGKSPWLEWITASFEKDDGEQGDAEQSAAIPELKPEGNSTPKPESEARPQ